MTPVLGFLEMAAVFVVGLLARMAAFVLVLAVITVPILLAFMAWDGLRGLLRKALGLEKVDAAFTWRKGLRYTEGHTWLGAAREGVFRLGLDDVARRLLFRSPSLVMPPVGARVKAGETVVDITAGGRQLQVASPVDGVVRAVNPALRERPDLLREDPYFGGWLVEVQPDNGALRRVREVGDARGWLRTEFARFTHLVDTELGIAAADGGQLHRPAVETLSDDQWRHVRDAMIRPASEAPAR